MGSPLPLFRLRSHRLRSRLRGHHHGMLILFLPELNEHPLTNLLYSQNKASLVKFYRDYSIADFSFCALVTLGATYTAFLSSARAGVCEELSHHPELMRDMLEIGLNSENCEHWLERALVAIIGMLFVLLIIRVCFLPLSPPSVHVS